MTLRHTVRPPSQPSHHQYQSLLPTVPSSPSIAMSLTSSTASSRPSTAYPIVTPQFDQTSLYATSVSDFTPAHHGGYDRSSAGSAPLFQRNSTSADAIPTTVDFSGEMEGGPGDGSVASSAWSSLEFDDLSELSVSPPLSLLIISLSLSFGSRDPLHVSSVFQGGEMKYKQDRSRGPRSERNIASPSALLSPLRRVPSARKSRPISPSRGPSSPPPPPPPPHHSL
jgi:hypothetical protein